MQKFQLIIVTLLLSIISCSDGNKELFNELKLLALDGSPEAQYNLGMFYNNGIGTSKNKREALKWFEKSANGGDPLGHYKLGCYYAGQAIDLVQTDKVKALEHKLIAATAGYAVAQDDVASIYYDKGKISLAIKWWELGAEQGDRNSFYRLFAIYYQDKNVPQDMVKAYRYLRIIEKNSDESQRDKIHKIKNDIISNLSKAQIEESNDIVTTWKLKKSELTVRALSGIEEVKLIVEHAKKI